MWKTLLSRVGSCLFLITSVATADAQLTSLTEGFDTTGNSVPTPTGIFAQSQPWVNVNNSDVPNTTAFNWQQGDSGTFIWTAQSPVGSTTSFAQVSFLSTNGTILSDWLLTPVLTLEAGATFSFYTVAAKGTTFANDLQVYISTSGSSTNVGSDAQTPTGGVFTLLPGGDLNPTLAVNGYPLTQPNGWTLETFTLTSSEVSTPTSGRIGLRYFIPNTATQGSGIGVDTFSFADPTIFTRTVSGNWTDTTGWTPNGLPNGNTVMAQLVNPSSGANSVNLGGGTFTVNQLQFSGTNAGTWNVTNGTIIFDGTNPTFLNQGDSSGLVGSLPNLQLNATTTFEIDNASAVTNVTGDITGTGGLTKTGSGTLLLTGTNTYTGGTTISAGTLQIGNGGITGSITGDVTDNGVLAFDRSDSVTFAGVISGTGSVSQIGSGTTILTGTNTYSGGTTISSGTLQIGNGGTAGSITGGVTDNGVLAFDRSDSVTFAGVISGTGRVSQIGSGTTILTGTNTYSGGTTISSGTLQIGNGGTAGSIAGNVTDTGVLAFDRSDSVTFAGAISGTGSVTQIGSGTTILTGTNTYTGGTTISSGTLQIGNGGTAGSITGNVTDNGALAFDRSDSVTFAGMISGTGSVTQIGTGTTILTGTNTYSGGTTISSGTLQIGNGGTAGSITGNVTDNGALAFDRSDSVTFAGVISGTGSVTQIGIGTTILTGTNTYSGGTTISAGTLQVGNGATTGSITGNVTDNGVLTFDRSDSLTFAGVISGTGGVTQIGTGTTILTGTNTYNGGTTIGSGTLQIGNGGTAGSITGNVTDNGVLTFDRSDSLTFAGAISGTGSVTQIGTGTTILTGTNAYSGGTTISSGTLQIGNGGTAGSITGNVTDNGVLAFDRSDSVTFAGAISSTGSLTQIGTGTTILTGTNTYSGGTTISSGTLQIGNGGTAGSITGNVIDNGILAFDRSDSVTFAGVISGTGSVTQIGTGTTILTGTNTYNGGTTIGSGTLQIGNGGTAGSITGNVTDAGVLAFDRSDSVTFAGAISGTGSLTQIGTGTTILTGTNTYGGGTTISAGTLQAGSATALSQNSAFTVNSTLDLHGFNSTIGSLSGTGAVLNNGATAAALTVGNDNASTTFSGVLQNGTGALQLTKSGTGTLTLTGANTYSGGTSISAGTLQIGNAGTTGSITGAVTDNGVLAFDRSDSVTFAGAISGTGSVTQIGTGTTILTGTNTYGGGTTISAGTLQAGSATALSQNSAFTVNSTLDLHGFNSTIGSLSGTGAVLNNGATAAALTVGNDNASTTFSGVLQNGTGALQLTKSGTGTLTLTGANAYSGGTSISTGTLQLGNGGTTGSITGAVTDNGVLAFDRNDSVTFAGAISGTGSVTQIGPGTTILTGTNTYSGGTTISSGTLQIGNGGTAGSITGNVTDAGVLAFDRSDSVTFAGVISGTGSVPQIGPGTTILTGTNTYSGGTTISAGTLQVGSGGTAGSITGNVTDNGVLAFDRSDSVTFAGVISGTGSVTQIGTGTTILTGTNTYNSGTTIGSGTLQIGNGGTAGSITGNVTDAGVLAFDRSDSVTFAGVISGTGSVTQIGPGTTILTGTNTYTGGTTISAGTLQVGNGGTAGIITGNVTDNGVLAFDRSDSVTFAGVISGTGSVTQIGIGTTILTGTNTYSGGTTISAGTLQVGNGGPTGSIIGNVTDNGSLIFNRSKALSIGGVISGAGSIEQNGSGATVLSGINTYSGGTIVNAGTLTVNSAQALGLGAVEVNGGILRADPQPINVLGNYTQNAGGTLQLQVAGANRGQYDTLNVGGNAALGGTLQLLSLGFQPKAGNQLTLVTTGGVVSGRFAQFLNPFPTGPGFNTFDLVYGRNSVQLQFLNVTTPISPVIPTVPTTPSSPSAVPPKVVATLNFASFAFTPNQRSTATLLDQVELDPRTANLIGFLFKQPLANLPGDFEQISPAGLTAFYEISFSGANIQKLNLEGRFDDIRNGANGFRSNVKVNGASVNLEDKATADRNSSKAVVEPILQPGPENRWGVWMTGFGDFVSVDADSNAQGYGFTTGGVSLGIDYRILDHLAIGVMGDYAHTWTSLNPSGHIDVDTGRGGVYATWFNQGLYLNAAIYGGHNSYDSSRSTLGGLAAGGTEGAEFSTFAGGGYDFNCGHLTVGPIASIQYTYVNINGFSEKSSLAPLEIHSASAESLRTDFGFRASFHWQIGKILVEPAIKAAWEHEYKYSALPITAGFAAIPGPAATFFGPSEGHDSAVVSAGITVQLTPMIATYLNYDGQLGRDRYDSNAVTGGVRVAF